MSLSPTNAAGGPLTDMHDTTFDAPDAAQVNAVLAPHL